MRAFANGFLLLFLADALASLLGSSFTRLSGLELPFPLAQLRGALDGGVLLASFPLYGLLGITPRLPKRIFLPPALFVLWVIVSALPLPIYLALADVSLIVAALQLALALASFGLVRRRTGGRWLLAERDLAGPLASARTFGWFVLANAGLVLPAVLALLAVSASLAVSHLSAGFLRLDASGLYSSARVYERGDRSVYLVGMMHIGGRAFYDAVGALLPREGAVVLREGVSDRQGLLPKGLDYGRLAGELGLDSQANVLDLGRAAQAADLDVSDFDPRTRGLLQDVGELLKSHGALEAVLRYATLSHGVTPDDLAQVKRDVIERRNEHLLGQLDAALGSYSTVVVPWGAAHMPELERSLLARGFTLRSASELRVIAFGARSAT